MIKIHWYGHLTYLPMRCLYFSLSFWRGFCNRFGIGARLAMILIFNGLFYRVIVRYTNQTSVLFSWNRYLRSKKKIISYYLFYKNKFQKATLNLYFFIKSSNRVIITVIKNRLNQLIFWEKNASATWGLIKADIKATNCCKMVHHY